MLGGQVHVSEGFLYARLQFLGSGYEFHFFQFFYDLSGFLTVLQVISVAGTVLGIFCTAFAYVMVLGVNNLLRYYYIQKLEDRLHELISYTTDDKKEGPLLHWNAYIALL